MNDLITKYRPTTFEEVRGQDAAVKSIQRILEKKLGRAFLLIGPSGTGKTTLARIIARTVGCNPANIREVDAATFTGIDAMKSVTENLHLAAFGDSPTKVVIIDETHALSKAAWQSLLKIVEEPPPHVFFIFCTTEAGKVPETIQTRCKCFSLKAVDETLIYKLLRRINKAEELGTGDDVLVLISEKCEGSPRRALSYLTNCAGLTSRKEASQIIRQADVGEGGVIELCRALIKGSLNWTRAIQLCQGLEDQNAESLRIVVFGYFAKALLNAKSEERARPLLAILETFREPYPTQAGIGYFLYSLGSLLLAE